MAFIKHSLAGNGIVETFRLHSVLERPSMLRYLTLLWHAIMGLLCARPIPLQALLFSAPDNLYKLKEAIRNLRPDTIYFDGVRSGLNSLQLRRLFPSIYMVCDFDDLMSRRIRNLAQLRQPISAGYLGRFVSAWIQRKLLDGVAARAIQFYEYHALRNLENRIGLICNKVVLVSSVEASQYRSQCTSADIVTIPLYMDKRRAFSKTPKINRFIFIGADSQLQNRLTIEYLVSTWARLEPRTELHIYGKQCFPYASAPGVVFHGFVDDLSIPYQDGSVLLAPSFVSGGVKTKVIEAISYGIIPIGNTTTFEGIEADCSGLILNDRDFNAFVCNPDKWASVITSEALKVADSVATKHDPCGLAEKWRSLVWPSYV